MSHSSTDALENGLDSSADGVSTPQDETVEDLTDKDWRGFFKEALDAASNYQDEKLRSGWTRNYRAFASQHVNGSKYTTSRYRQRSKLFKPKTRSAVRKNSATAASAMFSTDDVVSITPERASDPVQKTTAKFLHEVLNYRLDKAGPLTGPSWFLTAIGARQDTQITGICVSKQYWEYVEQPYEVEVEVEMLGDDGLPLIAPETGEPVYEREIETRKRTIIDRLMIDLLPAEHAYIDPTGDWRDPIQEGGYFVAAFPMRREDLRDMMENAGARPRMGGIPWRTDLEVDKIIDQGAGNERRNAEAVRRARNEGIDRYQSRHADRRGDTIWCYEAFYRYGGIDWHWWMLGETVLLSDPVPVDESYPAHRGQRPYVRGVGEVESHKTHPIAPVESWRPLQNEMNEITNIRLDTQKMSIAPITKIRRGRNVDTKQVQNRGPDATFMVQDPDDVMFEKAPSAPNSTQLDINNLNVDFDELAGVFSPGSVQTNRQLNETVGGMQMLSGASNSMTEFDLRVFVETWVEPMLLQCVWLLQYYETSKTAIAVAGEKAGLLGNVASQGGSMEAQQARQQSRGEPTIPLSVVMANIENVTVHVKVNVGIGALDSKQKLEKFVAGSKMTMEMLPILEKAGVEPNALEMAQEAWGLLGYKDAARFFQTANQGKRGPPPEVQREMLKLKADSQKTQAQLQSKERIEAMKSQAAQVEQAMESQGASQDRALAEREFLHRQRMDLLDMQMRAMQDQMNAIARQMEARRSALNGGEEGTGA